MSNIYSTPKNFNLKVVAEIEFSDGNYQFDTRVVWQEMDGPRLWTMRDSGCSCPTPFEDYSLSNIDPLDFEALRREVNEEVASGKNNVSPETAQEFLAKVKAAISTNGSAGKKSRKTKSTKSN